MENKVELKKCLVHMGILVSAFLLLTGMLHYLEFLQYQKNYNSKIGAVLDKVQEEYGEITEQELVEILQAESDQDSRVLEKHGYQLKKDSVIKTNDKTFAFFLGAGVLAVLLCSGGIMFLFLSYNEKKDRELLQITKYIEEINKSNYRLEIDTLSEDELSMLKTEIYKTTVMLKEVAEQSKKDKENLKQSLSDISHQLKTPITSMLVLLDNLIEEPDMEEEIRMGFIRTIKREIGNMQFLIQALLKMSKLDSGTVEFFRGNVSLSRIVEAAIENVSVLSEIKNVSIETTFCQEADIYCDYRWQLEAVTNILKNCVEHSPEGSKVFVSTGHNLIYGEIKIRDFGPGMDQEDVKHIFERFYRGKNAGKDSVGIGLSLAKTIVEQDNGRIFVESGEKGTEFAIKYYYR